MEDNEFSSLPPCGGNDTAFIKVRRHPRRTHDRCAARVRGKKYPVKNWSISGLLMSADERRFSDGVEEEFRMMFALRRTLGIGVEHKRNIVRRCLGEVAIEFAPLTDLIRGKFQKVIDKTP